MSINKFISKFHSGARTNLFRVEIPFLGQDLEIFCKGAQFPGHTIEKIPVYYQNNTIPVAGDIEFTDWTITIINDKTFYIRDNIEKWSQQIKSKFSTFGSTDIKEYFKDCNVYQLDENEKEVRGYRLYHAWPVDISPIELGYDTENSVEQYTVTFTYTYYEEDLNLLDAIKGAANDIKRDIKQTVGNIKQEAKNTAINVGIGAGLSVYSSIRNNTNED